MAIIPKGILAGLLGSVAVAALARFRPILTADEVLLGATAMVMIGLLAAVTFVALTSPGNLDLARFLDQSLTLRERATTAFELASNHIGAPDHLATLQVEDATVYLTGADWKVALRPKASRQDLILLSASAILLAVALLLPNPIEDRLLRQREEQALIEEQAVALSSAITELENNEEIAPEVKEEIAAALNQALEELGKEALSLESAVAALTEAEQKLNRLAESGPGADLKSALIDAGTALQNSATVADAGRALQQGDGLQAAAELRESAAGIAGMSSEEREQLAASLGAAAASLAETNPELAAQLGQAASELQNGATAAAAESLGEAAETIESIGQAISDSAAAASAASTVSESKGTITGEGSGEAAGTAQSAGSAPPGGAQPLSGGAGSNATGEGEGVASGGPSEGGGHTDSIFAPESYLERLSGGSELSLSRECQINPADCGQLLSKSPSKIEDERSLIPYSEVLREYRTVAYEQLNSSEIPLGMKSYVRDYFSSLGE